MSEHIYANQDMSRKVRYNRNVQEDKEEREAREVVIYEITDAIRDHTDNQSHGGGPDTERHPPAVQRKTFRAAALCLAVLCFLMMTGIIILSVYFNLLQTRYNQLSNNNSQLQDEVKQLKDRTEDKSCADGWTRFGCSCYFKSKEEKNWSGSRADCHQRGADLVIINNEEKKKIVTKLSKDGEYWIGLLSMWRQGESKWKWVDGSPLTETFWAAGLTRSNDGYWSAATCCDHQGKWTQSRYDESKNWICEKKMI
ncbi:CD209 antigen-like protein E [Sander lucioperca]|uniref:CD209 antigen-like protein E n=1 Tax=Sander lucioperca TaxID=283035 RepID=UPI001653AC9E|nr:CD209 antigen-like protein E [Sander lucioperca]